MDTIEEVDTLNRDEELTIIENKKDDPSLLSFQSTLQRMMEQLAFQAASLKDVMEEMTTYRHELKSLKRAMIENEIDQGGIASTSGATQGNMHSFFAPLDGTHGLGSDGGPGSSCVNRCMTSTSGAAQGCMNSFFTPLGDIHGLGAVGAPRTSGVYRSITSTSTQGGMSSFFTPMDNTHGLGLASEPADGGPMKLDTVLVLGSSAHEHGVTHQTEVAGMKTSEATRGANFNTCTAHGESKFCCHR